MDKLYLEGTAEDNTIWLSAASYVTLFLVRYCKRTDYRIFFVENADTNVRHHISVPACFGGQTTCVSASCVPAVIRQCVLPALRLATGHRILSGLCGVLRNVVQTSVVGRDSCSSLSFRQLLGHKQICLKACAEVSAWTKFCEVEMPAMVDHVLYRTSGREAISLPEELIKLENQFKLPVVVSNIGKRRHQAQNIRTENSLASQLGHVHIDEAASPGHGGTQGCDVLKHSFVEGIDFTLADLVLFSLLHCVMQHWHNVISAFEQQLPLTVAWYRRVRERSEVKAALQHPPQGQPQGNSGGVGATRILIPSDDSANLSIREVKRKKFKASAMDIDMAMDKFKNLADKVESGLSQAPELDLKLPWEQYPEAVHPKDGELPEERLARKCQQLQNLAAAIVNIAKPGHTIVDFCSGGGHLGILVGYLLPECKVILVENKEESVDRAENRIVKLKLSNITIYQCNLDYFQGKFDIGTCLHACGVATDLVLQTCLDNQASFVICPCCYGNIQDTHTVSYPRSQAVLTAGIAYKEYLCVGHGADQTQFSAPSAQRGKMCMEYIDKDRAALALEHGYKVTLATLQPPECSPKNNLIVGTIS